MTPEEIEATAKIIQAKIEYVHAQCEKKVEEAREQTPKKSNLLDKLNLGVTVLALIIGPACWLLISQKIELKVGGLESSNKDTYVDKPTYSSDKSEIWKKVGEQENHIDSVDSRENGDKASTDLKIQSLQDREHLSALTPTNNVDP